MAFASGCKAVYRLSPPAYRSLLISFFHAGTHAFLVIHGFAAGGALPGPMFRWRLGLRMLVALWPEE
ncbi:hypothetical protein KCP75_14630 [Salmonella enterica subsp. enterica]|nr:hypothetical protein KCP75_14630 [Salmonella enterica subsp. enterica]